MSCTVVFPASKPVRDAVELKVEAGEIHVRLAHHNAVRPCAECGRACKLHDHQGERSWRHLDTCQYQTMLHAEPPRAESAEHGVRVVKLPWAEPSSRFTVLLEALTIEWLKAVEPKSRGRVVASELGRYIRRPGDRLPEIRAVRF